MAIGSHPSMPSKSRQSMYTGAKVGGASRRVSPLVLAQTGVENSRRLSAQIEHSLKIILPICSGYALL